MKNIALFILLLLSFSGYAQEKSFDELLVNGKAEFKKEFEKQDFKIAVKSLEAAVSLNPNSAEAHYFLGYAYSRLNAKDGKGMVNMSLPILLKTSAQFEQVIALEPKYSGESIILDPYSKITSEWGSMAMHYVSSNKIDSAKWAFSEGKKRGGFSAFVLQSAKNVLDACAQNGILISYGDTYSFPLWYCQYYEGYRKDVAIVDIGLTATDWYPKFLTANNIVDFAPIAEDGVVSAYYYPWKTQVVTIKNSQNNNNFTWNLKSRYGGEYLGKDDICFLSLLKKNEFKRPVYFTKFFDDDARLSLSEHIMEGISVDKLNNNHDSVLSAENFKLDLLNNLALAKLVNFNSEQEVNMMGAFRYIVYNQAEKYVNQGNGAAAKEILLLVNNILPRDKFPVSKRFGEEMDILLKSIK